MTRIKGGVMSGQAGLGSGGPMAVSPDGTKLALTADTTVDLNYNTQGYSDKIVVIDLRDGRQSVWQGGMYRAGKVFSIPSLSWTVDGRSLVYLALSCEFPRADEPLHGHVRAGRVPRHPGSVAPRGLGRRDAQQRPAAVASGNRLPGHRGGSRRAGRFGPHAARAVRPGERIRRMVKGFVGVRSASTGSCLAWTTGWSRRDSAASRTGPG